MAAIAGDIVGISSSMKQAKEGKRMQKRGERLREEFRYEDLNNAYRNVGVSTAGADLTTEQAQRTAATSTQALRSAGARGILGGLGQVQANVNEANARAAADLDRQQKEVDMAVAQDDAAIRTMTERRQADELAGIGNLINQGINMKAQGNAGVSSSLHSLDSSIWSAVDSIVSGGATGAMGGAMGGGGGK